MQELKEQTLDAVISGVATKASYGGSAMSITAWLLSNNFAAVAGVFIAFAGFCVSWYYRHQQNKREQAEFERRMGALDDQLKKN